MKTGNQEDDSPTNKEVSLKISSYNKPSLVCQFSLPLVKIDSGSLMAPWPGWHTYFISSAV